VAALAFATSETRRPSAARGRSRHRKGAAGRQRDDAWYPASVTKIMTAYVTLKAVKEGA
jgi:CubicO group peptidase (beta-lactamase class C family)